MFLSSERQQQLCLHPNVLVDSQLSALMCCIATVFAIERRARLTISKDSLKHAYRVRSQNAPLEMLPVVKKRMQCIRDMFEELGLFNIGKPLYIRNDGSFSPEDWLVFKSALEFDGIIVSLNADTFPRLPLREYNISVIGVDKMFFTMTKEASDLLATAMYNHRDSLGESAEVYKQFLKSRGLTQLCSLVKETTNRPITS